MVLGLSIPTFTTVHVIISLVAIASGLIVLYGMVVSRRLNGWTLVFLAFTILTSVTGFLFPRNGFTPAQGVGLISLVILALSLAALYLFHLSRAWRWIYVATAVLALYLNVFVLVIQGFQKVSALHALAPTQSEPPFVIAQTAVLIAFVVGAVIALRKFHPERGLAAA